MKNIQISAADLHRLCQARGVEGIFLNTLSGISPLRETVMKKSQECVTVKFPNHSRVVAESHRFMGEDGNEVFALNATNVMTKNGVASVQVSKAGVRDVYDVMIDAPHWYIDQHGVIHHNTGKTLCLVALSADYLRLGLNVLYITQEMREEAIMNRIDANLLDVAINNVVNLGKDRFMSSVEKIRAKSYGRLKVKEFPPSTANALHFERLVEEYAMQHNFVPDVIMVDYIQITASYKMTAGTGSYYYYKSVAEELRALAVKRDLVMWTVSQFNRGGMDNTNPSMSDIGESTGIPATADAMWAIMRTDELDQIGQLSWKQLKSRYADKSAKTHFMTGVDVERQQFLNIQESRETVVRRTTDVGQSPKDRFAKMKFQGAQK